MERGAHKTVLRSLLRELRVFDGPSDCVGPKWWAARALLPPQTLNTLLSTNWTPGDGVLSRSILYQPSSCEANRFDFRRRVRNHLRKTIVEANCQGDGAGDVDAAIAAATVAVSSTGMRLPLLVDENKSLTSCFPSVHKFELMKEADNIKAGDLLVAHPYLTDEGLGGCIAVVLRHSAFDTLALVLNVDACVGEVADGNDQQDCRTQSKMSRRESNRPSWRLHVYLPPLASEDARCKLPASLRNVPLRWGGGYPVPLHLLHSVPLVASRNVRQNEPYARLTGHQVYPGLWCSYVDDDVVNMMESKLEMGVCKASDFGAFVGMLCLEPKRLEYYMHQNHWFVVRPHTANIIPILVHGWGGAVQTQGRWVDDRNWDPWRCILHALGGEFRDWANIDWIDAVQKKYR